MNYQATLLNNLNKLRPGTIYFRIGLFLSIVLLMTFSVGAASAGTLWPAPGVSICDAEGNQYAGIPAADGSGGVFLAWGDTRDWGTTQYDLYVQKMDQSGQVQWGTNGLPISQAANWQLGPSLLSDGSGGVYVAWRDRRNGSDYDIYIQHLNAQGGELWTPGGVPVCTSIGSQYHPNMISDGADGVIIAWYDQRDTKANIFAQRLNSSGVAQWLANGKSVYTSSVSDEDVDMISDSAGGGILVWIHKDTTFTLYVQRIDGSGTNQWTTPVDLGASLLYRKEIVADGAGGVIVVWDDERSAGEGLYAQRLSGDGSVLWSAGGEAVCNAAVSPNIPTIAGDGAGGVVIAWRDDRSGEDDSNIYAQYLNASGTPQWAADGVEVCTAANHQTDPNLVRFSSGNTVIAWLDSRESTEDMDQFSIYSQKLNGNGKTLWSANGEKDVTGLNNDGEPYLTATNNESAFMLWRYYQSDIYEYDLYVQLIGSRADLTPVRMLLLLD